MNVLVSTLNSGRGSGVVVVQQCRELLANGHTVTYVSSMIPSEPLPKEVKVYLVDLGKKPIPIHEALVTPSRRNTVVASQLFDRSTVDEYVHDYETTLRQTALETHPDVIISHHANLNSIASARISQELHIPLLMQPHGTCIRGYQENGAMKNYDKGNFSSNGYTWGLIKNALHQADSIIAISHFVAQELIEPYLDPESLERVKIIGNFVESEPFDGLCEEQIQRFVQNGKIPLDREGKPKKGILYLGPLTERKGAVAVAGIGKYLNDPKRPDDVVPIYLMGRGEGKELEDPAHGVYFIDNPTNEEKRAIMKYCGLVGITPNLSSKGEDFGIVQKEFGLAKVPVIAPADGVYMEHVVDGVTGFLIPPQEQTSQFLADKTRDVIHMGDQQLSQIGENARKFVLDHFNKATTIEKFIQVTEELVNQYRGKEGQARNIRNI